MNDINYNKLTKEFFFIGFPLLLTGGCYLFSLYAKLSYLEYFGIPNYLGDFALSDVIRFGFLFIVVIFLVLLWGFETLIRPPFIDSSHQRNILLSFNSIVSVFSLFFLIYTDFFLKRPSDFYQSLIILILILLYILAESFFSKWNNIGEIHFFRRNTLLATFFFNIILLILSLSCYSGFSIAAKQKVFSIIKKENKSYIIFSTVGNSFVTKEFDRDKDIVLREIYLIPISEVDEVESGTLSIDSR